MITVAILFLTVISLQAQDTDGFRIEDHKTIRAIYITPNWVPAASPWTDCVVYYWVSINASTSDSTVNHRLSKYNSPFGFNYTWLNEDLKRGLRDMDKVQTNFILDLPDGFVIDLQQLPAYFLLYYSFSGFKT